MPTDLDANQRLLATRNDHIPRGLLTAHPIFLDRAEGAHVWDVEGRRYLDFVGGIGVLNVGHNHPRVIEAVIGQLRKITHTSFQVAGYAPYVELAQRLNRLVGGGQPHKTIFLTTGAEAVENAVKIARAHTGRPGVIAFRGGFHGRTLLGVSLTGFAQPYRQNFGPFAAEVYHAPYPDAYRGWTTQAAIAALQELFATQIAPDRVAAILIEPVQGDGGFIPAPADFLRELREMTRRHGIVLVLDEIQTGFGRTGTMFGFQHAGIEPDLVTVAKSLAGGFPLAAVVGRAEIMDAPAPGGLGGTYGGNAVACAAALAVLDAFEHDGLLEQGLRVAARLRTGLESLQQRYEVIGDVRGLGPMLAMELVRDRQTKAPNPDAAQRVMDQARERGLLFIKCGVHRNVVRFLAPLVTQEVDIESALAILDGSLQASYA